MSAVDGLTLKEPVRSAKETAYIKDQWTYEKPDSCGLSSLFSRVTANQDQLQHGTRIIGLFKPWYVILFIEYP